jgi:hypothetical protein
VSNPEEKKDGLAEKIAAEEAFMGMDIDGWGAGMSSLLTLPPTAPFMQYNERRSGSDRRATDRRLTARAFKALDKS